MVEVRQLEGSDWVAEITSSMNKNLAVLVSQSGALYLAEREDESDEWEPFWELWEGFPGEQFNGELEVF